MSIAHHNQNNAFVLAGCMLSLLLSAATFASTNTIEDLETLPPDFEQLRDPFTPPGFRQADPVDAEEVAEQREQEALAARIQWPTLKLRGISHIGNSKFIAIVQDIGLVEAGEEIWIERDNLLYTWRVENITAKGITTTRLHVTQTDDPTKPVLQVQPPAQQTSEDAPPNPSQPPNAPNVSF